MGGKASVPAYSGPKRKLVIVGGSFGGMNLVKNVLQIDQAGSIAEILVIDQHSYFEYFPSLFENFVDPEAFNKTCVPY